MWRLFFQDSGIKIGIFRVKFKEKEKVKTLKELVLLTRDIEKYASIRPCFALAFIRQSHFQKLKSCIFKVKKWFKAVKELISLCGILRSVQASVPALYQLLFGNKIF